MRQNSNYQRANKLNHLVKLCKSAKAGYEAAMENVENITMKEIFLDYSSQRAAFAAELRAQVRKLQYKPEENGSLAGFIHRSWIHAKGTFSKNDCNTILPECIYAESHAIKTYHSAIESFNDSPEIKKLLEKQLNDIVSAYTLLKASHEILENCASKEVN